MTTQLHYKLKFMNGCTNLGSWENMPPGWSLVWLIRSVSALLEFQWIPGESGLGYQQNSTGMPALEFQWNSGGLLVEFKFSLGWHSGNLICWNCTITMEFQKNSGPRTTGRILVSLGRNSRGILLDFQMCFVVVFTVLCSLLPSNCFQFCHQMCVELGLWNIFFCFLAFQ